MRRAGARTCETTRDSTKQLRGSDGLGKKWRVSEECQSAYTRLDESERQYRRFLEFSRDTIVVYCDKEEDIKLATPSWHRVSKEYLDALNLAYLIMNGVAKKPG